MYPIVRLTITVLLGLVCLDHWVLRSGVMGFVAPYVLGAAFVAMAVCILVTCAQRVRRNSIAISARGLFWHAGNLFFAIALSFPVFVQSARLFQTVPDAKPDLRVITANLWNDPSAVPNFIKHIQNERPHILFVQEAYEPWRSEIAEALPNYKRIAGCDWAHNCNAVIYSRIGDATVLENDGNGFVAAQLDLQPFADPARVLLISAHISRANSWMQDQQIALLEALISEHSGPVVLAGDFNLTPWDPRLQAMLADANLLRFSGLMSTWPTPSRLESIFGVRIVSPGAVIDHVFASELHFRAGEYSRFDFGSDHYGVQVNFGFKSGSDMRP